MARERLGIVQRGLVVDRVRVDDGPPLDHVQRIGVNRPVRVEPRLVVEIGHVNDERVALLMAA
jgi:hypothetical protein